MYQSLHRFKKDHLIHLTPDVTVGQALAAAEHEGVHHLPVLAASELVGLVCTCDLETQPENTPIGALMKEPITLSLEHTRADAAALMNECAVGSVILLDDEEPVGIVTRQDLMDSRPPGGIVDEIARCSCCGTTKHLRTNLQGRTLCVACRKLPRSAQLNLGAAQA